MNKTEYIGKLNALYVGDKNCLEELITAYDEKDKEIERLKGLCDKYEEEHKTTFEEWKKAINIIKEVRKYIKNHREAVDERAGHIIYILKDDFDEEDILKILDKGSDKE